MNNCVICRKKTDDIYSLTLPFSFTEDYGEVIVHSVLSTYYICPSCYNDKNLENLKKRQGIPIDEIEVIKGKIERPKRM